MSGLRQQLPVLVVAGKADSRSSRMGMLGWPSTTRTISVITFSDTASPADVIAPLVRKEREYDKNQVSLLTYSKTENYSL